MGQMLSMRLIRADAGCQPRAMPDAATVAEYADAMRAGAEFPPVIVFHDGTDHYLADGYHRYGAAQKLRRSEILADVRQGALRDAVLFSLSANQSHGLRRTNGDKRRAVIRLLQDDEWRVWSDGRIADHCGVSQNFVSEMRREFKPPTQIGCELSEPEKRLGRDGKMRPATRATAIPKRATVTPSDVAQEAPADDLPVREIEQIEPDHEIIEQSSAPQAEEAAPQGSGSASITADDAPVPEAVVTDLPDGGVTEGHDPGAGFTLPEAEYDALVKRSTAAPFLAVGRPVSAVEYCLSLLRSATKKVAPEDAAEQYAAAMFSDDITLVNAWLNEFEQAFRERFGVGTPAAIEQGEAA